MPHKEKEAYWEDHRTRQGYGTPLTEGSVGDRGGDNDKLGFTNTNFKVGPKITGYGFGKKKRKKAFSHMAGGYKSSGSHNPGSSHNPGNPHMSGGY